MLRRKTPKAALPETASVPANPRGAEVFQGEAVVAEAAAPSPSSSPRILSICEDIDGALRISRHLATLGGPAERQDLTTAEAVERLRDALAPRIDLVLFAPSSGGAGRRPLGQELVELAVHRAGGLVVLPAPGQDHGLVLAPAAEVVVIDAAPNEAEGVAKPGFLARLFGRGRKAAVEAEGAPQLAAASGPLRLISLQSLAGGAGSTTLASLLAAEIAASQPGLRVLLIDLNLQFGQIGGYLDLKEDGRISDLYSGFSKLDLEAFRACLRPLGDRLSLLSAPPEILPLDALDPRKMLKFLNLARQCADLVILDLPHALPDWLDPIWREADLMVWVAEPGLRSSHAYRRLKALTEGVAFDPRRCEIWLNRVPTRLKRDEAEQIESLQRAFTGLVQQQLPEGGTAIRDAQIQGICPRRAASRSPLVSAMASQVSRLSPRLAPQARASRNAAQ